MCHESTNRPGLDADYDLHHLPPPVKFQRRGTQSFSSENSVANFNEGIIRALRQGVGREVHHSEIARWDHQSVHCEDLWDCFGDILID